MKVSFFTDFFSRRPRTLTASLLCVTLLFSDLPAQAQTPALPLSPAQVLIPAEYGRVEESRQAGSKTIFFLQDAHDSLEAQENIAALIHHLVEKSGIKTVFEEGYEGPVPADDYFGPLKDPEVREKVSYYLLDQLRIGGAEYAHINRKQPFKLVGGDDARLHRENIAWYRKTAEHREEASQGLKVLQQEIVRLADRNFPVQLKEWMKLKTRFDQGKISFWDYLQRLREPGAAFFHEGLPAEAMTSRFPVLSRLYRAAMKDLSQELRDGDVNAEVLFRETSDFENAIADTLITLERDRQTFTFYKTLELLLRLNSLEVSYDEYQALRDTLPQAATEDFARFISLHANRSVSLSKRWEENVRNAMQFYETAGARDRAVEKKLIEFKADAAESSAVLVFGGFHRSAIREILRRQGFSYQIISPVISEPQEKHRERYRHLMAADYETRFVPASVSAASRALSDIAVAELSPVYKRRFAEELNVLGRAAMKVRGGHGGDVLLGMQQELKKQPETLRSELRAEDKFQRAEKLTQEILEEEVRKLGETSLEVGGNDRTGWAVSTEKRYDHDRLHALERTLSKRFKGYRFSFYHDVRTDQDFKRLDILPPLSSRSELRPELKNVDAEVLPHESKDPQAAASGLSGRSELRGVNGILLGAGAFENPLWLLAVPPALAAAVYFFYQAYLFWISKRIASALAQGARYVARGSYTHVLKHAGFPGYVILVKRHPFVMRLKQGEAIRSPQVTEAEEWKAYKALKKFGLVPFTRYAGKFPMKSMHPEWAGTEGEDVFRADQKKLAEMYGKVSGSMTGVSVYLQEEGVPLNQFVRENPDQKSLADKSLASFTLNLWKAGWIDLDIGRRNYLLVTDREGNPLKNPDGLFRLKAHDFGAIMPIPEDLEQFMLSKHLDSDVTRGFFLLRNLTATVRTASVLFPRLDLKRFHEISKAADEAAERMKARGDKAAFRSAYLGVIDAPENKKVITELSIHAARMIRMALEGTARSELRAEDAGEGKERKRIKQRVRAEAEKRVLAARKVLRTRIIFIGFASAALLAGAAIYWMLPNVPAQPEAAAPSEAVIERQRFATIRGIHIADSTRNISSQQPELIDAIAEGYDAADRVRKSQIASYELIEGQAPAEEGQVPGVVFQVQPHTPLDVAPPFEPVQIRRDAAGRLSPVDLQGVRNSVSGGRIQTVEQVREWMAWLPLAAVGLMAVLAYAFLKGVRRVDTGSIMDVKNASDRSARDIAKLRDAAEKKSKDNENGGGRSELRIIPDENTVNRAADVLLKFIGQQSGEKLSKMGYRFTIVHDVEQVTMRNLLLNFWPEVTELIGTDNPEVWVEKLEGINEGQMGRAVLDRIRPMFLSMSRFGRHADEGQEDFRRELGRVFEQRAAEENPEPVRILAAGPGYLQEAVEVLAAADASIEALAVNDPSKLRLELIVADQPGELADHYQLNNLVYHSRDVSFFPEAVRDRYLEAVPGGYRIRPEAHERLNFRFLDLNRHRDYGLLGLTRESVDFVLNYNLDPYLQPRALRRLSEFLHAAMRDSGIMYGRLSAAHFDRSMIALNEGAYWLGDLFENGIASNDSSKYPNPMLNKFHKKGHSSYKSPFDRDWMSGLYEEETRRENALDPEDEGWLDRVLAPARSELRAQDPFQNLKGSLLSLMTVEGRSAGNKIFNDAAEQLKDASPSVKGRFKKLLLELLDNSLERQALREIGSFERETSAWQRALYRRLYEHLYDENGSLRKDIKKLETAPSAAVTLKYEDTFTVRAGRRKETLRVERLTSLSQSDWNQIFEIYAPYNLRDFHRDLMSGRRSLSGKENAVFVVRTFENKIAGFSWAFADPAKKMLGLAVSAVAKPYRGKGLAARLLISRLEWGVSNGLTYARTHVGDSGRGSGWHWRLLSLGGSVDSLILKSPLPEIGIRPEEQAAADRAVRAAQQQAYPGSRKALEAVLKKYTDADLVVTFDLRWRVIEKAKGRVLDESVRSELRARADESSGRQPLKEQMDQLLAMYPPEGSDDFYDLTDEKGFFRGLRELLRQYQKAESARNAGAAEARSLFEVFQKSLTALLARLEFLAGEDYSKLAEFNPGAANATFGVMAVQLKPEILQDETPRQFFFGPFSLKQLTESGALKVDVRDGVVVSPLPEVKGVLADLFPEVMREKLEQIQKLTASFWEGFQESRSELRTEETSLQDFVNRIISSHAWPDIIEVDIDPSLRIKQTSASLGFAIFELLKNAIDGNRVYEKKSGTDSRPDVRLTAARKDGWVELRIENRGVLAVDKLRAQAREDGVWKLRPWTPDKHLWPYPYIMESSMPEEPMPYQRMRPEEVDAMADEDLLFHVKGLTLRSDENLRRIGLLRADLTGGMGIGLKQVWRVMETVDPERPVHYEMGEIDGAPSVAFSLRLPEAAPRSELRTPSEAEYEQIAAEAERLRELVEVHSLLRNKPDGTGKSDIVKALAEARDLSRERGDIERIAEIVKRANGWYPGRVNTNYFQFDDRNIKKQLAAFSRSVQKVLRDSNAGRSELRMYINDLVRQQFVIAGVPFLDEHIPTDKGVFRPTLSGLVDPLAEYAGHYKPIRIIDLGSGQGAMVFAFARANDRAEVLGIEYDEQLFNDSVKVRDSFFEDTRKRIRLERGDFNDPRFAEEIQKADLVNYWETGARAEGTMLLNLAKNMRAGARFLVTKNSGRFIKAVKDTGYFDLAEEVLDDGIFLFTRNDKPFEGDAAAAIAERSELRTGSNVPSREDLRKQTRSPAPVRSQIQELSGEPGREAMTRLRDAMASALARTMSQRGYRVELLPGYPEGLYVHLYPSDPVLAERLSRIDHTSDLRLIEVPYGSLGMALISIADVDGELVPYIEQIQPSYSFRKAAAEESKILGTTLSWAEHFVEWTEVSARAAGFQNLFGKTPFVARRQNIEMGHGKANRYYSKPFRKAGYHLTKRLLTRSDMSSDEVEAANRSSQYLNAKKLPQFLFGGNIPVWHKPLAEGAVPADEAFLARVYQQHRHAVFSGFKKTMQAWGARRFIFLDGMKFGDERTWWKDISRDESHGEKDHTGIDLALYQKQDGSLSSVSDGLPVFALMDGRVRWIFEDNMRQTVITETQVHQRRVYSVYTHIQAREGLKAGQYLLHGEPLGTTASSSNARSIVAAHVHYGLGFFRDEKDIPAGDDINYDTINGLYEEGKIVFADLLRLVPERSRAAFFASGPEWESTIRSILIRGSRPEEAALRRKLFKEFPGLKDIRLDAASPIRDLSITWSEAGWRLEFSDEMMPENFPDAASLIDRLRNIEAFRAADGARSELRDGSAVSRQSEVPQIEKMTVPAAVFLDARELTELKAGQADERFDELLTFLERHPAFDLYIDRGDQYPLHNLELPKLRQILSEFPGRVHFGERSRANLAKKKILLQVSLFEDSGSSAETRKLIQDIQRRYRIQSDLLPVEYLLPGSLKGFLGLAESFTQAELIREIGEAYATRSAGGRWRLAADFAASLWARIQNDYAIQWSA